MTHKIQKLPPIGLVVTYLRDGKSSDFTVVEVDKTTGRIELLPHDLEGARTALKITVKNKFDQLVDALDFGWIGQTGRFAVNVEWDAWTKHVRSFQEDPFGDLLSDL